MSIKTAVPVKTWRRGGSTNCPEAAGPGDRVDDSFLVFVIPTRHSHANQGFVPS
jgi:hypothetical protein